MKTAQILLITLMCFLTFRATANQNAPADDLVIFATGINNPVCITHCGDSRLFVIDQTGYIYIVDSGGNVYSQPFLDIHERVTYGGERGLLGLAFHPDYFTNGYFYVNYVGEEDSTHISRFSVTESNPDLADPDSEFQLMTIFQPYSNHKGGDLCFGPDGYLYIGLGDGGSGGDPQNNSQNPMSYLGKMLRIDVDGESPYSIPASNPFYNFPGYLGEIWALGLRNPWRFSFDRLTGDMWIADVGQNAWEEIDFQPASSTGGENYGWRCYEGNQPYNTSGCGPIADYVFPVHVYSHGEGCSVTGGYVFRGNPSSLYYGRYFFTDYCTDMIWTLRESGGDWIREDFGHFPGNSFSTFGEDASGQLYVAGLSSETIYLVAGNAMGIDEDEVLSDVRIIQEPFSGKVRVENKNNDDRLMLLDLFDLKGNNQYSDSTRNYYFEIDTANLPSGVYFLKVTIDGKSKVQKLVNSK
jgi:hypothetical protein